jgi:predicted SPOUT superfamily RNA methylase MTH1
MNNMKRRNSIAIAVPSSMVAELYSLRDKTTALGQLGRAAAIYRVDQIIIYRDQPDESLLMKYILGYLETPQYLRKRLCEVRSELQYVGILPPLKTPHHPTENNIGQVNIGEYRDGVVIEGSGYNYMVDIGLDFNMNVRGKPPKEGTRISTKIMQIEPKLSGMRVKKKEIPMYWGYDLRGHKKKLSNLAYSTEWDLTIATSKKGEMLDLDDEKIRVNWIEAEKTLIVFGSYKEGVGQIISREGKQIGEIFDYIVNTIPFQGTETIRTEEAVMSTLAIFNIFKE